MPLTSGSQLGPYEILAPAGAGGMGEVYRARDTRLGREVAIKVLPPHLASSPELRARLEREARSISSLQHPNICTLFDVGHQDGLDFLVMEFLEGETLAERLKKGPLPTDQLLKIAIDVADALDKAHRQGIVHRDLKPGNVMLTRSGAKLMDFGLAKPTAVGTAAPNSSLPAFTAAVTQSSPSPITVAGTMVGTFQYMSPEQIEGREADARSDIFAFGAVLYEMATAKRAFEGKSQLSVASAILERHPPPISEVQPLAPPALEHVIERALAKDPAERWQTAHDLKAELQWIALSGSKAGVPVPVIRHRKLREGVAWALAGVAIGAALIAALLLTRPSPAPQKIVALIAAPDNTELVRWGDDAGPVVVSPDGRHLAFVASSSGTGRLWVQPLDSPIPRMLPGTENATFPFWAPDSRWIGFFASGKLKKVTLDGAPPLAVADAPSGRGGAWNRDNIIVFAPAFRSALFQVPASGGTATPLTKLDESKHSTHRWPYFLPDGKHFLYLALNHLRPTGENTAVYAGSLDGTESRLILRTSANAVYARGHLLFLRESALMAQPFDPADLQLSGEPRAIASSVLNDAGTWHAGFSASDTGAIAFHPGTAGALGTLTWFDNSGKQAGTLGDPAIHRDLRISPDGNRVAVTIGDPGDIWIYDVARGIRTRFTFAPSHQESPVWSYDGASLLFTTETGTGVGIAMKAVSGATPERILLEGIDVIKRPTDWSRDAKYILYSEYLPGMWRDLWVLPLSAGGQPIRLTHTEHNEDGAVFSPDGHWVAYNSAESGRDEVYVARFLRAGNGTSQPGLVGKWQISTSGGVLPVWIGKGEEIRYVDPARGTLISVPVKAAGEQFEIGPPRVLLSLPFATTGDMSPDGKRVLLSLSPDQSGKGIALIINWDAGQD